jgi:RNA ligase
MNKEQLDRLVEEGILYNHEHEELDLTIYNYTQDVQFHKLWDENTLQCRGLILNSENKVIARPFKKFFNWEELQEFHPKGKVSVYEKLDGSLGILCSYKNEWIWATRGSFYSTQAYLARDLFEKYKEENPTLLDSLDKNYTYLFEIVGPSNVIVNQYEKDDLIFLGAVETESGKEIFPNHHDLRYIFPIPEYFGTFDFKVDLIDEFRKHKDNFEGYIFVDENNYRFKLKLEEYVRLHRIITGFNSRSVWEFLSQGKNLDEILIKVPEEFYNWVKNTAEKLNIQYMNIMIQAFVDFLNAYESTSTKKEFALKVKDNKYSSQIFALYNKRVDIAREITWKQIRPKNPTTL